MEIKLTDTERTLILENCRTQLQAMGHESKLRFVLDISERRMIDISIYFDFCIFSIGYTFDTDGTTTEYILYKIGNAGFQETYVYPNDTRDALVNRWITRDYSFWPEPEEATQIQEEWFNERKAQLMDYLNNTK